MTRCLHLHTTQANVERMTLMPLTDLPKTAKRIEEAEQAARAVLQTFDVTEANCFADDRDHLLASLESGFSDLDQFNSITSQALLHALDRRGGDVTSSRRSCGHV